MDDGQHQGPQLLLPVSNIYTDQQHFCYLHLREVRGLVESHQAMVLDGVLQESKILIEQL